MSDQAVELKRQLDELAGKAFDVCNMIDDHWQLATGFTPTDWRIGITKLRAAASRCISKPAESETQPALMRTDKTQGGAA